MIQNKKLVAGIIFLALFIASCKKETPVVPSKAAIPEISATITNAVTSSLTESFETGSKSSYTSANVSLSSGSWFMEDALIGNSSTDRKNGSQAARIRNAGTIKMNFDYTSGASVVSIRHALYGSDGNSTWELRVSMNGGNTFTKIGSTVITTATTLQTATFDLNISGNVRFAIVKTSGGTNRINIDDIEITPISGGSGPDDDNMLLGNPSNATAKAVNFNNYLMVKSYYALSYSRDRGTPNWVSWHIQTSDLGTTPRQDDFRGDNTLPAGWYQVDSTSYSGGGFDRGHNCPSADRTFSIASNSSTFLMTNMIPQAPNNNQRTWANLENYIRSLVQTGNEVYVIMGSYGVGGTGSIGTVNSIDNGRITVPSRIWKVIVVLPKGSNDISRVTSSTRVISVSTPNINTINSDWKQYRTTVDAIESSTSYNLLSSISATIQNVIEAKVDNL